MYLKRKLTEVEFNKLVVYKEGYLYLYSCGGTLLQEVDSKHQAVPTPLDDLKSVVIQTTFVGMLQNCVFLDDQEQSKATYLF